MFDGVLTLEFGMRIRLLARELSKFKTMNKEEKRALFGENYWNNLKEFNFLPGEQAIIIQMREVSQELLKNTIRVSPHDGRNIKQSGLIDELRMLRGKFSNFPAGIVCSRGDGSKKCFTIELKL